MPDRMVREAARFSDRLESVSKDAELMWWRLLTVPDDFGTFYADAAQLRSAVWPSNRRGIRIADVARWRDELTQAGAIAQFEVDGIRYIELLRFGQAEKLRNPRRRFPERPREPDDPAQMRMPLVADPPKICQPTPQYRTEQKRRESAPPAPQKELQEDWLARLAREWPGLNVLAELEKATRKKGKTGEKVERAWFERSWLPNCSEPVQFAAGSRNPGGQQIEPEPEAWRVWLESEYPESVYAKGGTHEGTRWSDLSREVRAKIVKEMQRPTLNAER